MNTRQHASNNTKLRRHLLPQALVALGLGLVVNTASAQLSTPPPISFKPAVLTPLPGLAIGGSGFSESTMVNGNFNSKDTDPVTGQPDKHLDLLISNPYLGFAPILMLGNGDGTFRPGPTIAASITGWLGQSLLVGDFNKDGNLDFAVAGGTFAFVNIYLGDGHGHFTHADTKIDFQPGQSDGFVQDINGDGFDDLVIKDATGIRVYLNDGHGNFPATADAKVTVAPATGIVISSIKPAKFHTGNNIPDLAACDAITQKVYKYLGHDDGTGHGDGTYTLVASADAGIACGSLVVGDFNADGIDDVAAFPEFNIVNFNNKQFLRNAAVLISSADGGFKPAVYYHAGLFPANAAIGDLNGDGKPDLVSSDVVGNSIVTLAGYGDVSGTFVDGGLSNTWSVIGPNELPLLNGYQESTPVGDYNEDGKPDIATTVLKLVGIPPGRSYLSVLINNSPNR